MVLEDWPIVSGRYYTGNKNSSVAVCTLASIDLLEKFKDVNGIAIVGKAVTENIGIEKIVQNIISNTNIRFLIVCGKESYGHYVGQAIISLVNNGIDEKGNIIGATGPLANVKNLTKEQVDAFRKQIKTIDLIGCKDMEKIMNHISECEESSPGVFKEAVKVKEVEDIVAKHDEKEFVQDSSGFFTIFIKPETKEIVCEHYTTKKEFHCRIVGKNAEEISATISRLGLVSRIDHAAYLGRELQKAEIALKNKLPYEQERELKFKE